MFCVSGLWMRKLSDYHAICNTDYAITQARLCFKRQDGDPLRKGTRPIGDLRIVGWVDKPSVHEVIETIAGFINPAY